MMEMAKGGWKRWDIPSKVVLECVGGVSGLCLGDKNKVYMWRCAIIDGEVWFATLGYGAEG